MLRGSLEPKEKKGFFFFRRRRRPAISPEKKEKERKSEFQISIPSLLHFHAENFPSYSLA